MNYQSANKSFHININQHNNKARLFSICKTFTDLHRSPMRHQYKFAGRGALPGALSL